MLDIVQDGPDRFLATGTEEGFEWVVAHNNMGSRNGYIRIPADHPWHNGNLDSMDDIDVHGGITYHEPDTQNSDWWIGFDTAHCGDAPDLSLPIERSQIADLFRLRYPNREWHVWSLPEVIEECQKVCRQAAAAIQPTTP